jgi:hypothetical protein
VRTDDGAELTEAVVSLTTGQEVHCRLVFRDPDPVPGQASELWQAQIGRGRGHGTDPLSAAAAALNDNQHQIGWRGP